MSWSVQYTYNDEGPFNISGPMTKEHKEQFHTALTTVQDLILSGVVGDPNKRYNVIISGHGNPDHEPTPGWANDTLQITIIQV